MSFEFSPEAILFQIQSSINEIDIKIDLLTPNIIQIPQAEKIIQQYWDRSAARTRTRTVTTNLEEINDAVRFNHSFQVDIAKLQQEKTALLNQIPILEKDIEVKSQVNIETGFDESSISLIGSLQNSINQLASSLSSFDAEIPSEINVNFPKADSEKQGSNIPLLIGAALVGALIL